MGCESMWSSVGPSGGGELEREAGSLDFTLELNPWEEWQEAMCATCSARQCCLDFFLFLVVGLQLCDGHS